jgi:hypothetical protein
MPFGNLNSHRRTALAVDAPSVKAYKVRHIFMRIFGAEAATVPLTNGKSFLPKFMSDIIKIISDIN